MVSKKLQKKDENKKWVSRSSRGKNSSIKVVNKEILGCELRKLLAKIEINLKTIDRKICSRKKRTFLLMSFFWFKRFFGWKKVSKQIPSIFLFKAILN